MRFGDFVWQSARIEKDNAEISEYSAPKKIRTRANYFSVMPASSRGYLQVMPYGEDLDSTWTAIANSRFFQGEVKEGDLFWLDGEKPIPELEAKYGNGATANAVVKSVSCVNFTISIILTRNKDKVKR